MARRGILFPLLLHVFTCTGINKEINFVEMLHRKSRCDERGNLFILLRFICFFFNPEIILYVIDITRPKGGEVRHIFCNGYVSVI